MKFKEAKAKIVEKNRTPLRVVKLSAIFLVLMLALTGLSSIILFVMDHSWRSPIIFQSPYYKENIKSPLGSIKHIAEPEEASTQLAEQEKSETPAERTPREIVEEQTVRHFGTRHVQAMHTLIYKESSYNPKAQNPNSTAYGLFQFLNQTWKNYGCEKTDIVEEQVRCGIKYIKARYGNPSKALKFHLVNNYY